MLRIFIEKFVRTFLQKEVNAAILLKKHWFFSKIYCWRIL